MIHVKKNIRDSFQFVFFFFGVGRGKLQMSFKKIKTAVWIQPRPQGFSPFFKGKALGTRLVWIGVNYVANNIILQ